MKIKNIGKEAVHYRGITFPVGEGVEVDDETAAKALGQKRFVEVKRGRPPKVQQDDEDNG